MTARPRISWPLFATVTLVALVADQGTKIAARATLPAAHGLGIPVPVIDGLWDWQLAYNRGAAFSMLGNAAFGRVVLTAVGFAAIVIVLLMARNASSRRGLTSLGLILGGTLGNLIDRVAMGHVTDFVSWHYHGHQWPIFNVADVALFIGVALLLIDMFRSPKADSAAPTADPAAPP